MRRLRGGLLAAAALALAPAVPAAAAGPSVLVSYSFDDENVATGPDTFAVYKGARGAVSLSSAFHLSGYRSVEIRDVAGDGDFAELQGYFPPLVSGRVYAHFAFLTTDPNEELNIALAGPRFFQMAKDGIAFWLGTRQGMLVHHSDSIPKKLFTVEAFVWYAVDLVYEVDAGTYDLTIRREGQADPLVALRRQPNATRQPGSAVDKFSFVSDPAGDRSNVTYYVDDVVIGTDEKIRAAPFVAPGRRKLFVDRFVEYERMLKEKPRCLPAGEMADFGMSRRDLEDLRREGLLYLLERLLLGEKIEAGGFLVGPGHWRRVLEASREWTSGCQAFEAGQPQQALAHFDRAAEAAPEGRIYPLSAVLALAGLRRFEEADERLAAIAPAWRDDPRYAAASAFVGVGRGDLDRAEEWLRDPAGRVLTREASPLLRQLLSGRFDASLLPALKKEMGESWREHLEETLVAEQYYYVLLWKGRFDLARDYALRMSGRLAAAEIPGAAWVERAGDAAFYARDLEEARQLYERAVPAAGNPATLLLKLSDIAFLTGDLETERRLRERYYGALVAP